MNQEQPSIKAVGSEPEDRETERKPQPRIYVASLSDYNSGRLFGAWFDAAQDAETLLAGISEMLARSESFAEEWAIHDYEGFGRLRLSEYESIENVARVARGIAEHGEAFSAWASYLGSYEEDQLSRFDDCYMGFWPSLTEYAEDLVDNLGLATELDRVVPELLQPYVSIDFASFGRDMEIGGDIVTVESSEQHGVFIFEP